MLSHFETYLIGLPEKKRNQSLDIWVKLTNGTILSFRAGRKAFVKLRELGSSKGALEGFEAFDWVPIVLTTY